MMMATTTTTTSALILMLLVGGEIVVWNMHVSDFLMVQDVSPPHSYFLQKTTTVVRKAPSSSFAFLPRISAVPQTAAAALMRTTTTTTLLRSAADLNVVGMVSGKETYGFVVVAIWKTLWLFLQETLFNHAKVLITAITASGILIAISSPMVTFGDATSVTLGLEIATGMSILIGMLYVIHLLALYLPSLKEIAFLVLLLLASGLFSCPHILLTNKFVDLPSLTGIEMLKLPFDVPNPPHYTTTSPFPHNTPTKHTQINP